MKRLTAILMALSLAFPAWAAAELDVNMEQKEENGQTLTVFSAAEAGAAGLPHLILAASARSSCRTTSRRGWRKSAKHCVRSSNP